uniref:Uncharacterized protein n=1 Tax=Glossina austeni TaxID=7395 RepID=A0A1A9UUL7_GLOAU
MKDTYDDIDQIEKIYVDTSVHFGWTVMQESCRSSLFSTICDEDIGGMDVEENLVAYQVGAPLQSNTLLTPNQSAYRAEGSCNTGVLKALEDIYPERSSFLGYDVHSIGFRQPITIKGNQRQFPANPFSYHLSASDAKYPPLKIFPRFLLSLVEGS